MIDFVISVDYEIYGSGEGSLMGLAFEPAEKLRELFREWNARFVVFPEVAEIEMIEANGADVAIKPVLEQLRGFYQEGHEIGLHIHPWWYSARYEDGRWNIDRTEYNLCALPLERITRIIDRAIAYTRRLAGAVDFRPISFRAGHLLFQPTQPLADVLFMRGIRLDSSVYRGGLWPDHQLDYRSAPGNLYYWKFRQDAARPEKQGNLFEVPIFTRQAPVWKLLTSKRIALQQKGISAGQARNRFIKRLSNLRHIHYPLKFDLGQMTKAEIVRMIETIFEEDRSDPSMYRPVVSIIHTKDPIDFDAVRNLLKVSSERGVRISTFAGVYHKIRETSDWYEEK